MRQYLLIGLLCSLVYIPMTSALNISTISTPRTIGCDGGTFSSYVYGTNPNQYLYDVLHTHAGKEGLISSNTSVDVYTTPKFNMTSGWNLITNYFPGNGAYRVVESTQPVTLNMSALTPADRNTVVAQVVYGIRRGFAGGSTSFTINPAQYVIDSPIQIVNPGSKTVLLDTASIVQDYECQNIYPRWCGDGLRTHGEVCDPADTSRAGWGVGGCDASCQPIGTPTGPNLIIKKAAQGKDGQYVDDAAQLAPGSEFSYTYQVTNNGTASAKKVTITDTFPQYVSVTATPTGTDWACSQGMKSVGGVSHATVICTYNIDLPAGAVAPTVTVPAKIDSATPEGTALRNIAYVCREGQNTPECNVTCTDPNDPTCTPPPPPPNCDSNDSGAQKDPACVVVANFDLSIKKYAKSEDVFASVDNTENFNYTIVVRNNGTGAVTGTTTVRDTLPAPITLRATPSGNDWTCTGAAGSADFTCTTNKSYPANTEFDVITIPVQVSGLAFRPTGYMNYAYVQNPNEADGKQCNADSSMPNPTLGGVNGETPTAVCNEDKNNFDPATVNPPNPTGFDLRIKKFVNGDDESAPVRPGTTALYTFTVQNLGALASSGTTTVTDTDFPAGISIASIASTQGDWSCTQLSATGFSCTMNRSLAAGEYASTISLTANIGAPMVPGTYRNIVCLSNPYDPNEGTVLDPSTGKYKVNNCDPAEVVIVPPGTFDLSIKKYVADITTGTAQRDGDHQTTNDGTDVDRDILSISQGGSVRYRFVVRNEGPVTATGTTTVEDTLPNGFTITGSVVGTGWTCISGANGNRSFTCTRTENLAVSSSFPEIVVNAVSASAILAGEYSNTAKVKNPGDTNPANNTDPANVEIIVGVPSCGTLTGSNVGDVSPGTTVNYTCTALNYTGALTNLQYQINCGTATGSWQSSNTGSCVAPTTSSTTMPVTCGVRDLTNPTLLFSGSLVNSCAMSITTTGGGSSGPSLVGKTCINGIATCAYYNSLAACTAAGIPASLCYSADSVGLNLCQNQMLSCSPGGGGGGCGNGVLESGEECDVVGAPWCVSCKLVITTDPGVNPTATYVRLPQLSGVRFGTYGNILMNTHRVVIGRGTSAFTLNDQIVLDIVPRHRNVPIMLPADRSICLSSTGSAIEGNTLCNRADRYTSSTRINGLDYVVIGGGFYQERLSDGTYRNVRIATPITSVTFFKGFEISSLTNRLGSLTPRDAFRGIGMPNSESTVAIFNRDPVTDPTGAIDLGSFKVRISDTIVGTTGTPVNRSIETFVNRNTQSILATFGIGTVSGNTTTSTTTTAPTSTMANITVNGIRVGNIVADDVGDIPALNGNQNIRAIRGDLTIICPVGRSVFTMDGVRTILVEGNIIFNCNTTYDNVNSSWAWIAKDGNIKIYNGTGTPNVGAVSNLAGVHLAIGNTTVTGKFEGIGAATTNTILRIDGSLYGNANPLFNSRLYARGTSAYDILTTGTIISYSNRALVNPPPLLSQYLNNYNVERVVK